jgi:zinc transport system ATP-binding protein
VLSGGELRRVLLAHALEPEPELLVLDEPATGLDEASSRWLGDVLADLRREARVTTLLVSHDVEELARVTDSLTMLARRVVAHGPTGELIDRIGRAAGERPPHEARSRS